MLETASTDSDCPAVVKVTEALAEREGGNPAETGSLLPTFTFHPCPLSSHP